MKIELTQEELAAAARDYLNGKGHDATAATVQFTITELDVPETEPGPFGFRYRKISVIKAEVTGIK